MAHSDDGAMTFHLEGIYLKRIKNGTPIILDEDDEIYKNHVKTREYDYSPNYLAWMKNHIEEYTKREEERIESMRNKNV